MTGEFPNRCPSCGTSLAAVRGEARLSKARPFLHCPLCGTRFGPYVATADAENQGRVFFDPRTHEYRLWVAEQGPEEIEEVVTIGAFKIRILCRTLRVEDCFFERLFVFRPEDETWNHRDPVQFSPLLPEFEYLIQRWSLVNGSSTHREYRVTTNTGWTRPVVKACAEVTEISGQPGASLFIWPNFIAPAWNRYYVSFNPPSVPTRFGSGRVEQIWTAHDGNGEQIFESVRVPHLQGGELLARPDRVVLSWTADGIRHFGAWRSDHPNANRFERVEFVNVAGVNLGLDFGTTNTAGAVHYRLPDEQREPLESLAIHDRTLRLLGGGDVSHELQWLPQPESNGTPLLALPTQLLFESAQLLEAPSLNLIAPLQYTIPYYQSESATAEARSIGQFKWAKALRDLRRNAGVYRALYLRLVTEMFLAEMVARLGIAPCPISLVATYPLAFGPEDMKLHRASFEQVQEGLSASTGFTLSIGPSLDESHAGQNCDIPHVPGTYSLFVDVGGGTTDLCVSSPDNKDVLVVDSAEYGGEDLNERIFGEQLTDLSPQQFRRAIRTSGRRAFVNSELFAHNNDKWQRTNKLRAHLQRGLVECAARYAAAAAANLTDAEPKFTIYMLGLGWMTIFAELQPAAAIAGEFSKRVNDRLRQMSSAGVASKVPVVECQYPENPKSVVARGAARCLDPLRQAADNSRRSYLLEDVRLVTSSDAPVHSWSTPIPLKSNGEILQLQLVDVAKFGFETTLPTPVQSNWPNELRQSCVYENVVVHSPFRIFLSDYKKGG